MENNVKVLFRIEFVDHAGRECSFNTHAADLDEAIANTLLRCEGVRRLVGGKQVSEANNVV